MPGQCQGSSAGIFEDLGHWQLMGGPRWAREECSPGRQAGLPQQ